MEDIIYSVLYKEQANSLARTLDGLAQAVRRARTADDLGAISNQLRLCASSIEQEKTRQRAATIQFASEGPLLRECAFHGYAFSRACYLCRETRSCPA